MKTKINILLFIYSIMFISLFAQEPESFFPHNVGDRWDYVDNWGYETSQTIIRDSIGIDGSHNLFYDSFFFYPQFRIDTSLNVFEAPQGYNWNYLLYKLNADTGEVWENPQSESGRWAWVERVESAFVFGKERKIKVFQYGPAHPDLFPDTQGLLENWLAEGIGLIYNISEGGYQALTGCIIAGDTFGILTSVNSLRPSIPGEFILKPNYPNPFNATTIIAYELQHDAEIILSIYDILGREVEVLYRGWILSGIHNIRWDASNYGSGIYFCRLITGNKAKTIKMILTK
jgi:hypothetical protein